MVNHRKINEYAYYLLIIGGLVWLMEALSYFTGMNLNIVRILLSGQPTILYSIYGVVGVATVYKLWYKWMK